MDRHLQHARGIWAGKDESRADEDQPAPLAVARPEAGPRLASRSLAGRCGDRFVPHELHCCRARRAHGEAPPGNTLARGVPDPIAC